MTAPADWLTDARPPLPHRVYLPLYQEALAASKQLLGDLEAREATAVLYRVEELRQLLEPEPEPAWPTEEPDAPTIQIAVKPPRWSLRWFRENLTAKRIAAGGASGLVLAITALGWFQ